MEARGLTPRRSMQARLRKVAPLPRCGRWRSSTILRDEIGHVAVGNRWYGCAQQAVEPLAHHRRLRGEHSGAT
jgi:uncharacterized ferritin-like protein (DUF455 family)